IHRRTCAPSPDPGRGAQTVARRAPGGGVVAVPVTVDHAGMVLVVLVVIGIGRAGGGGPGIGIVRLVAVGIARTRGGGARVGGGLALVAVGIAGLGACTGFGLVAVGRTVSGRRLIPVPRAALRTGLIRRLARLAE